MAEYINVEKPFLEKLRTLGWTIIDQGEGIPKDPAASLRDSFRDVTLRREFKEAVRQVNLTDGQPWLTDEQLEGLYADITATERTHKPLLEANMQVFEKLTGKTKTTVAEHPLTGETNVLVQLIDFEHWENNSFTAINQFRVDTPAGIRESIRPDIVCFVNGLPFIVIECKDVDVSDPLSESIIQIQRYANSRDDEFGVREGEERLFHYNLFSIATHGEEARFGTITGEFEHYLNWKDIFPESYREIPLTDYTPGEQARYQANGMHKEPQVRQEVLIHGMMNKEILLDVLRHFTVFMETEESKTVKVVCRYQQYRAVGRMLQRLRSGSNGMERSGVVWHTQGSGKSLTMVFFVRKLRSQPDLKDFKVIMMVDRLNLEDQLSKTARLTDEFREKNIVASRNDLEPKLSGNESDLSMVMVHKFMQEESRHSEALQKIYARKGIVPEFQPLKVVNDSERIVFLIDEAHRSQGGDMNAHFLAAFPNAAKIAFTGTPLLTNKSKQKTHEQFGGSPDFIDTYKIRQSVKDRATLDIVYQGKTSKDDIKQKKEFDQRFEDVFRKQNEEERKEIQRRYGTMQAYLENKHRLKRIANDLVDHYIREILPNGYKAMVVTSSVLAAVRYEQFILKAIQERIETEQEKGFSDEELLTKLGMLNASTIVTQQGNNEEGFITKARNKAKELKAVDNFKKDFNFSLDENDQYAHPSTGIAFLCVCDRLLTGFDAPIAQVMYLDKNLREHNLLQAIARVNRTKGEKQHGILVDYFGVSNHLKEALNIWGAEDEEDIKELLRYFRDIEEEIPVLEARYNRLMQLFEDKGIKQFRAFSEQTMSNPEEEYNLVEACIELAKSIPFRAQFDTYLKAFFDSLDLLFSTETGRQYYIPAKRLGYLMMRIRNRYKDPTMDLKWAKAKVRSMIDDHLKSLGIDSKIDPVSVLSDDFPKEVEKFSKTPKAKASEMEHALRRHIKVSMENDPGYYTRFLNRMEDILERYQNNWEQIAAEFSQMRDDFNKGRKAEASESGLSEQELPFYDLIRMQAWPDEQQIPEEHKEAVKSLVHKLVELLKQNIDVPGFWTERDAERRKLKGKLDDMLDFSEIEAIEKNHERLSVELMNLAKNRHDELTGQA